MKLNIQLFGGSVAIQTITETTDIDTNQSTFTIPAKMTTTGATYNNSNASMTMQWKYASASSWTSISKQTFKIGKNSSVTKSWTLTLTHNDDGSLENVQFRVSWYITDSTNGTTGATTFTPTTIPRASQPSLSTTTPTMGSAFTIYTNRVSDSFTHTIRYWFGNANGTIAQNVTTSTSWTPPLTLANQIPSATSGVGTIYCDTYQSGNLIGTKTINFTLNVPSNIIPSVSFTNVSEAGVVPSSWGIYVKNKSRIALAISGSGIYGSTISSYRISYYGGSITSASGTTNYLTQAGSTTFTAQVTDTRGRSASTTWAINVVDYYNPTISTAQVQRCDIDGNIDNNGEYMYISYGASISPASNKNTPSAVYKVGYRVHNTGNYTYVNLTTNANSYSASGMLYADGIYAADRGSGTKVQFSSSNTYDIQFYVKDYFMEYTNLQSLDTGFDLLNFNASGKAMAIGKVSEASASEEKLEIGVNTEIDGGNLTIKTGNNVYSPIDITGDNTNNESSIIYRNKANGYAYIVGCNTFGQEGWNIGFAGYGNLFRLTKGGDIYTSGVRGNVAKFQTIQDVDLNDIGDNYPSGFYKIYANANDPYNSGGTWYYVYQVHDVDDNQWCYQEVVQWWEPLKKFARRKVSGSWESWHILSHGIYELYNGNSTGDITLSDHAWNYSYIEIFYQGADNYNSVKVPSPHGKRVYLTTGWFSDNINGNFKMANIYINDTTISKVNYTALSYWNGGASASQENGIEIIKVIGYK